MLPADNSPLLAPSFVLVTGANGFIGKHLVEALNRRPNTRVIGYDLGTPPGVLDQGLREADVIYHLAGVNRPQNVEEFQTGNANFTENLCSKLLALRSCPVPSPLPSPRSHPLLVLSSSIQAELDNPYGRSKCQAEQAVEAYAAQAASLHAPSSPLPAPRSFIFRLPNVFGKWCRPNYNSVTATFCHNIAHDLPITISDPSKKLELVYIDDVIAAFLSVLDSLPAPSSKLTPPRSPSSLCLDVGSSALQVEPSSASPPRSPLPAPCSFLSVPRSFRTTLGELADRIRSFRASRKTLLLPSFADDFTRCLYATYLSYLDGPDFAYSLDLKTDNRGCLAEFMKSPAFGQIFVSRTKPGITRGNHYHHTKTEKFLVLEGEAIIRFRPVAEQGAERPERGIEALHSPLIEHRVCGRDFRVVDIPPGYTHSIENIGATELITLFWASEIFDPTHPDTYSLPVE
jgi:UDP-2-acetamido-2,6-beta-L-arabino-hexul-4-ose reductase